MLGFKEGGASLPSLLRDPGGPLRPQGPQGAPWVLLLLRLQFLLLLLLVLLLQLPSRTTEQQNRGRLSGAAAPRTKGGGPHLGGPPLVGAPFGGPLLWIPLGCPLLEVVAAAQGPPKGY